MIYAIHQRIKRNYGNVQSSIDSPTETLEKGKEIIHFPSEKNKFGNVIDCTDTADSQKIVQSKFCKIDFCVFKLCELAATWSASYTLKVAARIIANFNFASEAKCKKKTQKFN